MLPFFVDETAELFDSQLSDEKLQARPCAVLLLPEPGENAANGLGDRKELLLGEERIEQLRLIRNGAETAPDIELESAARAAFVGSGPGDEAEIVKRREAAWLVLAAGESNLELATEVLSVRMTQQEIGQRAGVGCDIERFTFAGRRLEGRRSRSAPSCRRPRVS